MRGRRPLQFIGRRRQRTSRPRATKHQESESATCRTRCHGEREAGPNPLPEPVGLPSAGPSLAASPGSTPLLRSAALGGYQYTSIILFIFMCVFRDNHRCQIRVVAVFARALTTFSQPAITEHNDTLTAHKSPRHYRRSRVTDAARAIWRLAALSTVWASAA